MLSIQYHEFAENCASTDANQALSVAGHVWAVATVEAGTLVLLLTILGSKTPDYIVTRR